MEEVVRIYINATCIYGIPCMHVQLYKLQNEDHATRTGLLNDICDGKYLINHPLFRAHSQALQIMLYYADIEVCNPLGSKTKKHKLGLLYMHNVSKIQAKHIAFVCSNVLLHSWKCKTCTEV